MLRLRLHRPRIRTVLVAVNLVILLLPLLGIGALRLYESELVRQTEASLIAQGSYLREHFRSASVAAAKEESIGVKPLSGPPLLPPAGLPPAEEGIGDGAFYTPLDPNIDLANDKLRPVADEAKGTDQVADKAAVAAGRILEPLIRAAQRYTPFGVRIVDVHGIVVASSRGDLGRSILGREEVARALKGEVVRFARERFSTKPAPPLQALSRGSRMRIFVALPVQDGNRILGAVILSRTPLDIEKALYQIRFALLRLLGGLVVIVWIVSMVTAKTISRPIVALIGQTERAQGKSDAAPLAHPGSYEVQRLSESISAMASALKQRAAYIEAFAQNVSHEFKTPIATLLGTVELMSDHFATMTVAERQRFLTMLTNDARRMERLVTRLLQLARADVVSPGDEATNLTPALRAVAQRFRERGTAVTGDQEDLPSFNVRMAPETVDSLLISLIDNAKQHGGAGVKVRLKVTAEANAKEPVVRLTVADDGKGISADNLKKAFEPFFTTAREFGGTGLGLSIARALIQAHGGRIDLNSEGVGKGVTVSVTLPLLLPV